MNFVFRIYLNSICFSEFFLNSEYEKTIAFGRCFFAVLFIVFFEKLAMNIAAALLKNIMAENPSLPALFFWCKVIFVGAIIQWLLAIANMPLALTKAFFSVARIPLAHSKAFFSVARTPLEHSKAFFSIAGTPLEHSKAFPAIARNSLHHCNQTFINKFIS